jgi:hypothetical protein
VYSARHKAMDRQIALKLLKSNLVGEEDKVARFRNEARVLSGLDHPNIIAVHAIGIAETGQPYMAMDIVTGDSLSDAIVKRGPFAQDDALRICIQICKGLQYAHEKKIIHRDIKPSNIILTEDADHASVAKLVDFGIAKMLDSQSPQLTQTGMPMGSIFYLSPGQLEGRVADASSDIYSLGCTLYEMLSGQPPFQAESVFQTAMMHKREESVPVNKRYSAANIDESVQTILDCMLQKDHHMRYQSAKELEEDLERALQKKSLKFARKVQNKVVRVKKLPMPILIAGAIAVLAVGPVWIMFNNRTFQTVAPAADNRIAAKQAYETARRAHAAVPHTTEKNVPLIPLGDKALELAQLSGDPLLMSDALDITARILRDAYLMQGERGAEPMQRAFQCWRAIIKIANEQLGKNHNGPDASTYIRNRFNAIASIIHAQVSVSSAPPNEDWQELCEYLIAARPYLDHDSIENINGLSGDAMDEAISRGNAETFRMAKVRAQILDLLGYDTESKAMELANLPNLKKLHTPAEIAKLKEIYGVK